MLQRNSEFQRDDANQPPSGYQKIDHFTVVPAEIVAILPISIKGRIRSCRSADGLLINPRGPV